VWLTLALCVTIVNVAILVVNLALAMAHERALDPLAEAREQIRAEVKRVEGRVDLIEVRSTNNKQRIAVIESGECRISGD
jgi:uncharacterized protein YpmB